MYEIVTSAPRAMARRATIRAPCEPSADGHTYVGRAMLARGTATENVTVCG